MLITRERAARAWNPMFLQKPHLWFSPSILPYGRPDMDGSNSDNSGCPKDNTVDGGLVGQIQCALYGTRGISGQHVGSQPGSAMSTARAWRGTLGSDGTRKNWWSVPSPGGWPIQGRSYMDFNFLHCNVPWSIAMWIKPNNITSHGTIWSSATGTNNSSAIIGGPGFHIGINNTGRIQASVWDTASRSILSAIATTVLTPGVWTCIIITNNGVQATYYKDSGVGIVGATQSTFTNNPNTNSLWNPVFCAGPQGQNPFQGSVGDFVITRGVMSAADRAKFLAFNPARQSDVPIFVDSAQGNIGAHQVFPMYGFWDTTERRALRRFDGIAELTTPGQEIGRVQNICGQNGSANISLFPSRDLIVPATDGGGAATSAANCPRWMTSAAMGNGAAGMVAAYWNGTDAIEQCLMMNGDPPKGDFTAIALVLMDASVSGGGPGGGLGGDGTTKRGMQFCGTGRGQNNYWGLNGSGDSDPNRTFLHTTDSVACVPATTVTYPANGAAIIIRFVRKKQVWQIWMNGTQRPVVQGGGDNNRYTQPINDQGGGYYAQFVPIFWGRPSGWNIGGGVPANADDWNTRGFIPEIIFSPCALPDAIIRRLENNIVDKYSLTKYLVP